MSNSSLEYLKIIYLLEKENKEVRVTDIAKKMNCSKPNVTKHLNILKELELIEYETYGKIHITNLGIEKAKTILEEDDVIYLLLKNILCINSNNLEEEASRIKSVISKNTYDSIYKYVTIKLGLNNLKCNFSIKSEKCRKCIIDKEV